MHVFTFSDCGVLTVLKKINHSPFTMKYLHQE